MEPEAFAECMEMLQNLMTDIVTKELVSAVWNGDETSMRAAIAWGGQSNITIPNNKATWCCLVSVAANKGHDQLLPILLEAGLSLEGGGTNDRTPLMEAAISGHLGTIEILLNLGADPLATTNEGWVALHHAARYGHTQCVAALVSVTPRTHVHAIGGTPVHFASYHGHISVLDVLLGAGWSLTAKDNNGETPLHWAAMGGNVAMVEYLLKHHVDPLEVDHDGWTPLDVAEEFGHHAVEEYLAKNGGMKGVTKELVNAVEEGDEARVSAALVRGGRPDVIVPTNDDISWCLVALAAWRGHCCLLSSLLATGLNVEGGGTDNRTPLILAATNGHLETIEALLSFDADPMATDTQGNTALHLAAQEGHYQCVAALVPVTPHTQVFPGGITPLHLASRNGHKNVVEVLVGAGWSRTARDSDGRTPLHWAAAGGNVEVAEFLVQPKVYPIEQDRHGRTATHHGQNEVVKWLTKNGGTRRTTKITPAAVASSVVRAVMGGVQSWLRERHQTHTIKEATKRPQFHTIDEAASRRQARTIEEATSRRQVRVLEEATRHQQSRLVEKATNRQQTSITEEATRRQEALMLQEASRHHFRTIEEAGNHQQLPKIDDTTMELINAVRKGDEVRVRAAISRGGRRDVTFLTSDGLSGCLVVLAAIEDHGHLLPVLLDAGLRLEGIGTTDRTPLMVAAIAGHLGTLETLLSLGADPLARDIEGNTALHLAAANGNDQCVAALMLVTSQINVHLRAITPVHLACCNGHKNVVEVLAGAGWSLTERDSQGNTPLHFAAMGGSVVVVEFLVQHNVDQLAVDHKGRTPLDRAVQYGQHVVEEWFVKNGGVRAMDEAHFLRLVRAWRTVEKLNHNTLVSKVADCDESWLATIPKSSDGHVVDTEGLTPLHVAAKRGLPSRMVGTLLERGVSPHVITPDNLTPADMARRGGHYQVLKVLQEHKCDKDGSPPEQLYEKLLTIINEGDDVQEVSRYLCMGAPIEPLGGHYRSALRLAVITDRHRTVSLLLASGASLPASLLQDAWHSPDVTPHVHSALIGGYCCRLRAERRRLKGPNNAKQRRLKKVSHAEGNNHKANTALVKGIDYLLKTIEGDNPWKAAWRWPKGSSHADMSGLLAEAARANCPMTASFLHKSKVWSFFSGEWGASALHVALEAGHHRMADVLIRDLGGCPYVPDANGRLPRHLMSVKKRQQVDHRLFEEERERLENLELSRKAAREKAAARRAMDVQESLFRHFFNPTVTLRNTLAALIRIRSKGRLGNITLDDGRVALLVASRKGFPQLIYLMVSEGGFPVDEVLDDICGTTALHEAASHGQDCCVALLLSNRANPLRRDTYGQTPRHLAAMFGHNSTCKLLAYHEPQDGQDVLCRAGTTATEVRKNFSKYLKRYKKCDSKTLTPMDRHDPKRLTRKLLKSMNFREVPQEAQQARIDFSGGEALEVRQAVMKELNIIMTKVSAVDRTYRGDLRLVGSSRDGSKLYAPDEYDVNIVIQMDNVHVKVTEREGSEVAKEGKLKLSVRTDNTRLHGNKLMDSLYEPVRRCLADRPLEDTRLSIVPPGLTSTQVGVGLTLAWQGQEYPMLLVGVDLVPVLEVPWHPQITRPPLTPEATTTMQLSNVADGSWRCSFAETEAQVLQKLGSEKRLLQLMGKLLLSRLKAEPWMPSSKKHFSKWYTTREWSIAVPGGFCFKNALLMLQEKDQQQKMEQQEQEVAGQEEDPLKELADGKEKSLVKCLGKVFRLMCADPEAPREDLATQNIPAYFGGDCEGRKAGDGAPLIVQRLEQHLEESQSESESDSESEIDTESE